MPTATYKITVTRQAAGTTGSETTTTGGENGDDGNGDSETPEDTEEIAVGQTVKVKKLTGEGPVKRRIMDMGITKGVDVFVRKVAPLGDPIEVTVRGYELSLRKADAEMIEVE